MADWDTIREITIDHCAADEARMELDATVAADAQQFTTYELAVEHACPDRMDEVDAVRQRIEAYSGETPE